MTRILCTGDLHLGQGADLGRPGDRLADQAYVLDLIYGLAIQYDVDAILNCGDTFEGSDVTPEQLAVYADFVQACYRISVPIVALTGNGKHDAAMRTTNGMAIFDHVPGITVTSVPKLVELQDGTTIACLPWVHPGRRIAAHDGGDRDEVNREAAGLLVAAARGLRAQIGDGKPAVLALHGSVSGAALPNGLPVDAVGSVPLLEWADLDALGYDAVVAAHIHHAQRLGDDDNASTGFYVGSPLPLNFGEAHDNHGVWILDLPATEEVEAAQFVPIESRRFVIIDADVTAVEGDLGQPHNAIVDAIEAADVAGAIVELRYTATSAQARRIDNATLRSIVVEDGAHVARVKPSIVREDRARVEGVDEHLDPLQALELYVTANGIEENLAEAMRERMEKYLEFVA